MATDPTTSRQSLSLANCILRGALSDAREALDLVAIELYWVQGALWELDPLCDTEGVREHVLAMQEAVNRIAMRLTREVSARKLLDTVVSAAAQTAPLESERH